MKNIVSIITFIILFLNSKVLALSPQYGLYIQSYPRSNSEVGQIMVADGKPINIKKHDFNLTFQLQTREEHVFGTIFRIITDKNKTIDFLFTVNENNQRYPILVTGKQVNTLDTTAYVNQWTTVSLSFNVQNGNIEFMYNGKKISSTYNEIINTKSVRISFGNCPYENFILFDAASINIRDIKIYQDNSLFRYWKMNEHYDNICYDEIANSPTVVKNGQWLIDRYVSWEKIYSQDYEYYPSITFDSIANKFYFVADCHNIYTFQTEYKQADCISTNGGVFVANYPNQIIYIPSKNQLLSYNINDCLFSSFNFNTLKWEDVRATSKEHDFWNNTAVFNPVNTSIVSFGGYGHYHTNQKLIELFPMQKKQYQYTINQITPRKRASSAIVDNKLYIFGGNGSPSGHQELYSRNYYDLYSIDLANKQCDKLWEIPQSKIKNDFVGSENMIYNGNDKSFYLFTSLNGGTLIRINEQKPGYEIMSLPIGLRFDYQYMYINLYYSPSLERLYAAYHIADANGKSKIEIYQLNYPPIQISKIEQKKPEETFSYNMIWIYIIGCTLALVISFFFAKRRIWKNKKSQNIVQNMSEEEIKQNKETEYIENQVEINDIIHNHQETTLQYYDCSKSCICFLGGFKVYDKEGNEITHLFTPILKNLLILLILYKGKDSKGINGHKLLQIMWPDKAEKSAQNNRNVYLSKLRNLLEKVGDISIVNYNDFIKIEFKNNSFCDYYEVLSLFERMDENDSIQKLLELILKGQMLPNIETDWVDIFKNEFSDKIIDLLTELLGKTDISDALKFRIADVLFQHDFLNEEALYAKCRILCNQGKKGLAKTVYNTFCKEYQKQLGIVYPYSIHDIIKDEIRI